MKDEGSEHVSKSLIKTPKQLLVVVVLAFLIPITAITLLTQFATRGKVPSAESVTPEAVAERIKPVASVMTPDSPGAAAEMAANNVAAAAPAAAPAAAGPSDGKAIYTSTCAACHGTGVLGAPKFGDKASWAPHLAKGNDVLHDHAIHGFKAMPPRGGNMALSDADVKAAVDYMLADLK